MKEMLKCIFSRLSYRYTTRPVVAMLTFAMRVVGATIGSGSCAARTPIDRLRMAM